MSEQQRQWLLGNIAISVTCWFLAFIFAAAGDRTMTVINASVGSISALSAVMVKFR